MLTLIQLELAQYELIIIEKMDNTKLSSKFTLWIQDLEDLEKLKAQQYSSSIREVGSFQDTSQFWEIFQFLKPINELQNCDVYLFKQGIKPLWEDTNNVGGGCFKIKMEKKRSNKLWETTIFATISNTNRHIDIMNGIRIKVRESFDQIQIWMNSGASDKDRLQGLKHFLKQNTQITDDRVFNYFLFSKK